MTPQDFAQQRGNNSVRIPSDINWRGLEECGFGSMSVTLYHDRPFVDTQEKKKWNESGERKSREQLRKKNRSMDGYQAFKKSPLWTKFLGTTIHLGFLNKRLGTSGNLTFSLKFIRINVYTERLIRVNVKKYQHLKCVVAFQLIPPKHHTDEWSH